MKFLKFLGILALVLIGLLIWAYLKLAVFPHKEVFAWKQKMTIAVQTPGGPVQGASVSSVYWGEHRIKSQGMGYDLEIKGEAVVLDLGNGRYLFALLRGPGGSEYVGSVAPASISGSKGRVINKGLFDEVATKKGRAAGVIEVPRFQYPLLVTFDDVSKPETVKRVDPDNLAATFGPGYAVKAIMLEITDEPVTEGPLEQVLGWLVDIWPNRLDGDRFGNADSNKRFANSLSANSFSTELKK